MNYDKLDMLIFEAIKAGARTFSAIQTDSVMDECRRLKTEIGTNQHHSRALDVRLQAIKRRGLIEFKRPIGWVIKAPQR